MDKVFLKIKKQDFYPSYNYSLPNILSTAVSR